MKYVGYTLADLLWFLSPRLAPRPMLIIQIIYQSTLYGTRTRPFVGFSALIISLFGSVRSNKILNQHRDLEHTCYFIGCNNDHTNWLDKRGLDPLSIWMSEFHHVDT
jgi:hypothetical protein